MSASDKTIQKSKRDEFLAPVADARSLGEMITLAEGQLAAAAGRKPDSDRTARLMILTRMAAQRNTDLLACTRESLYWAFLDAARCGLEWDGEHGALVPYNVMVKGTDRYQKEAKFLPMVKGLVHLLATSGVCHDVRARAVFRGDVYRVIEGTNPRVVHEPAIDASHADDDLIAAYAVFNLANGAVKFDAMNRADLMKRKDASRAKYGPWQDWFVEMCCKTVIKHGQKFIPRVSPQVRDAIDIDNRADSTEDRPSLSAEEGTLALPAMREDERPKGKGMAAFRDKLGVSAADTGPPENGEVLDGPPREPPSVHVPTPITDAQRTRIRDLCDKGGAASLAACVKLVGATLEREINTLHGLSADDADAAIRALSGAAL